ncbi:MAG: hypothetical protein K0S25_199 [Bacillus sp. (in: firmicutes)]|nr:hypothetical protein [Bacillus sp. (in: firmicutes)]
MALALYTIMRPTASKVKVMIKRIKSGVVFFDGNATHLYSTSLELTLSKTEKRLGAVAR